MYTRTQTETPGPLLPHAHQRAEVRGPTSRERQADSHVIDQEQQSSITNTMGTDHRLEAQKEGPRLE
eukprot:3456996-Pyramimonas_sp.AAC.1